MATPLKKSEQTRQQLLDAALRVISRKGYSSATVDEIVEEAGVSKGLAYYHFKNKAALAADILNTQLQQMIDAFEEAAAHSASSHEALTQMLELFAQRLYDQHEFSRFFMTEIWREGRVWSRDMRSKTQRLVDVVAEQFARGQREGAVATEVDPTFEAVAVMGALLTATAYYMGPEGAPSIARQDFVRKIIDFTHRSVAPLP